MTEQKQWKKESKQKEIENFKENPTFEAMIKTQKEQPEVISGLKPMQRLALARYTELRAKTGRYSL